MQEQKQAAEADTKEKIAKLRESYARLKAICGPQGINRGTTAEYARRIEQLQAQIN